LGEGPDARDLLRRRRGRPLWEHVLLEMVLRRRRKRRNEAPRLTDVARIECGIDLRLNLRPLMFAVLRGRAEERRTPRTRLVCPFATLRGRRALPRVDRIGIERQRLKYQRQIELC